MSKNGTCLPKKLDWMMRCKKEEMYEIMCTNGVFIHLPLLGSNRYDINTNNIVHNCNQSNLVSFLGTDETSIDRTMRQFYLLTTSFYVSCIQLKNKIILSMETLCHITSNSKAEIVIQKNFIEIYGLETQVRSAYVLLCALPQIKVSNSSSSYLIKLK